MIACATRSFLSFSDAKLAGVCIGTDSYCMPEGSSIADEGPMNGMSAERRILMATGHCHCAARALKAGERANSRRC